MGSRSIGGYLYLRGREVGSSKYRVAPDVIALTIIILPAIYEAERGHTSVDWLVILKKLHVAEAEANMSDFNKCISLGTPVEPDVYDRIKSADESCHSYRNDNASGVGFINWSIAVCFQCYPIRYKDYTSTVYQRCIAVRGYYYHIIVLSQDPVGVMYAF